MLTEKHNEPGGWKNELEGLTRLPGEAAWEKNAAWEKLHSRLQQKPRSKKTVWYWAAACLLATLTIPLMITNKKENIVVQQDPPQKQQPVVLQTPPEVPVTVMTPVQVEKKKVENNSTKEKQVIAIKTPVKKEEPVIAIAETNIVKEPALIITDTATTIATAIPVKKKLSVVHINEVESPSAQFLTTPNYSQKEFKIKFRNGKAANQTIASQQEYSTGFKIKLSTKN